MVLAVAVVLIATITGRPLVVLLGAVIELVPQAVLAALAQKQKWPLS